MRVSHYEFKGKRKAVLVFSAGQFVFDEPNNECNVFLTIDEVRQLIKKLQEGVGNR